jgi:hypothetical protein
MPFQNINFIEHVKLQIYLMIFDRLKFHCRHLNWAPIRSNVSELKKINNLKKFRSEIKIYHTVTPQILKRPGIQLTVRIYFKNVIYISVAYTIFG